MFMCCGFHVLLTILWLYFTGCLASRYTSCWWGCSFLTSWTLLYCLSQLYWMSYTCVMCSFMCDIPIISFVQQSSLWSSTCTIVPSVPQYLQQLCASCGHLMQCIYLICNEIFDITTFKYQRSVLMSSLTHKTDLKTHILVICFYNIYYMHLHIQNILKI